MVDCAFPICYYEQMVHAKESPGLAGETYRAASRKVTGAAIRAGLLRPQPCEVCGRKRSVHAHHVDYSRPLDVHWLCRWCHIDAHHPGQEAEPASTMEEIVVTNPRAAYVVDGETWTDLLRDLQRQVFARAHAEGFANASRRLKISVTTLWRFGQRCQKVANSGDE